MVYLFSTNGHVIFSGLEAQCSVTNHIPICTCPQGTTGDAFRQCIAFIKEDVPVQARDPCYPTPCGKIYFCLIGITLFSLNFYLNFLNISFFSILKVSIQYVVVPKIAPFVNVYQDIMAILLVMDAMPNVQ